MRLLQSCPLPDPASTGLCTITPASYRGLGTHTTLCSSRGPIHFRTLCALACAPSPLPRAGGWRPTLPHAVAEVPSNPIPSVHRPVHHRCSCLHGRAGDTAACCSPFRSSICRALQRQLLRPTGQLNRLFIALLDSPSLSSVAEVARVLGTAFLFLQKALPPDWEAHRLTSLQCYQISLNLASSSSACTSRHIN